MKLTTRRKKKKQNSSRSRSLVLSTEALRDLFLRLEAEGAYSLDLVSPTQYAPGILRALEAVKSRLTIPVIWNTGGYETPETIRRTAGLVDVFLTDFKYGSPRTGEAYAGAADYPEVAAAALGEMYRVTGKPVFDEFPDGAAPEPGGGVLFSKRLRRGIILRHLILPGERRDSMAALRLAAEAVPPSDVILALMRQYTPDFLPPEEAERQHHAGEIIAGKHARAAANPALAEADNDGEHGAADHVQQQINQLKAPRL